MFLEEKRHSRKRKQKRRSNDSVDSGDRETHAPVSPTLNITFNAGMNNLMPHRTSHFTHAEM